MLPEVEGLAQPGAQCPLPQLAAFTKQGSYGRASQLLRVDALREWVSPDSADNVPPVASARLGTWAVCVCGGVLVRTAGLGRKPRVPGLL